MAGKFVVELIPGTVEEQNPLDTFWTDREYSTHLRDLKAAGRLSEAAAFPAVHGVVAGDPRTRYTDATLRPWFVFFDGDASAYAADGFDTARYDQRHYFVLMTDAHNVPPAVDGVNPTEQQARDRLNLLAGRRQPDLGGLARAADGALVRRPARGGPVAVQPRTSGTGAARRSRGPYRTPPGPRPSPRRLSPAAPPPGRGPPAPSRACPPPPRVCPRGNGSPGRSAASPPPDSGTTAGARRRRSRPPVQDVRSR